jgi:hypothetical protein
MSENFLSAVEVSTKVVALIAINAFSKHHLIDQGDKLYENIFTSINTSFLLRKIRSETDSNRFRGKLAGTLYL